MDGLLSCEVCFFLVLCHKGDSCSCAQTLPLCKNASAIVVTESEMSNQFMLTVFSKSVVLRTKVSFNKSEVIALYVQFACQFSLIDVTSHFSSPLHCRASITTLRLIMSGSGTLPNVHHSSMMLVINVIVAGGHMSYAHSEPIPIKETVVLSRNIHIDKTPIILPSFLFSYGYFAKNLYQKSHRRVD